MAITYGVLRGRPDRWVREANADTPHLQIRVVDSTGAAWRIAVNVQSDTGADVVFWLVDPLVAHPILASLETLSTGFTKVARAADHALDYVRAPLFDWADGRALPASGSAAADDLQDALTLHLDQCKNAGGEVFAFGAKFDSNLHKPIDADFGNTDGLHGIHDIHLNQGNQGPHSNDNATFHDGGLILASSGRTVGLFLGFQTQKVPTDTKGAPTADAISIGDRIGRRPQPGAAPIYLERALINPAGNDPGREVIVLGNLATDDVTVTGWKLIDKNQRTTTITATIPAGTSTQIHLDGSGVQLGNNGGNLLLLDDTGTQVDVAVYTSSDAKAENRYVRLHS